jgi:putative FmdB family regulatory protein
MPIYEYECKLCRQIFETLIRSSSDVAHCPACGNTEVVKQLSIPATAHSGRSNALLIGGQTSTPGTGCGRPECGSGSCAFG